MLSLSDIRFFFSIFPIGDAQVRAPSHPVLRLLRRSLDHFELLAANEAQTGLLHVHIDAALYIPGLYDPRRVLVAARET